VLALELWEHFYSVSGNISPERFLELPNQETIGRVRRKFNELGKYLPTSKEVAEKRSDKQIEYRKEYGNSQTLSQLAQIDQEFKQVTMI
jgi:hypothetical protein